jgi:hypothetical protein
MDYSVPTTFFFPVLLIGALIVGVAGLNHLAGVETRRAGKVMLAPKLLFGLIAGVAYLFYLDDAMVSHRTEETVRSLFHLPDDVEIGKIHGGHREIACYNQSIYRSTTVQFTPEQFAKYIASIHDRSVWRPVVPSHYVAEKSNVRFPDDAIAWQSLPEPPWTGKQQMVWKIAGTELRRGLALCYEFSRVEPPAGAAVLDGRVAYTVASCNPRARARTPAGGARVTAGLDSDRQRLNVSLHFDSKPDYCNNRLSKWLNQALGVEP